ncbi:hypothetical protein GCM10009114_20820 [Aliiglaciecola litoralis]|uniref:Membrane protein involved in the export of O-antigen and teichoic acid n=2 Tax=Aliiglaciecola litoralis TaxID=582857 RepID=A0ABN1LJS9_9ALTE
MATLVNIALQLLQLAILARYIETAVFGQFAILNVFVEIFAAVALGGISNYLMHNRAVTENERNTIFLLSIIVGLISFFVVLIVAYPFLYLINQVELIHPLSILSVLLIIHAVGSQYQTLALLSFKHHTLAKIDIFSRVIAFIVALLTMDLGLYCLIGAALSFQFTRLLAIFIAFSDIANLTLSWQPSILKNAIRFGMYDLGGQWLNITRRQIDTIILSMILPLQDLGAYHLIKQLASKPAQAIQPIVNKLALPLFSHVQESQERFVTAYYDIFRVQAFVLSLFYAPLVGASHFALYVIYGEELASHYTPVLAALSLFWFVRTASSNLNGPVVQVSGKTHLSFYWNLYILPLNAIVMYFSSGFGIFTLVTSMLIFQLLCVPAAQYFVINKVLNVQIGRVVWMMIKPMSILVLGIYAVSIVIAQLDMGNFLVSLCVYGISFSVLTFAIYEFDKSIKNSLENLKNEKI